MGAHRFDPQTDYRLMGKLGEGTFSEVLKVRNKRNAKYYAMKRFKKHFKRFVLHVLPCTDSGILTL